MSARVQRPRVLFVAPELPYPPFTGAHTRPLSLIRALARSYDVTVVGAAPAGSDLSALDEAGARVISLAMSPYARSPWRSMLAGARQVVSPVPLISRGGSPAIGRLVRDATERARPDVLHLVSMYSCWYRDARLPAVIDLLDVVSDLCDSAASARPLRYCLARVQMHTSQALERRELAKMAEVIAINDEDARRLSRLGVTATVVPLSVAVPTERNAVEAYRAEVPGSSAVPTELDVLFVGNFAHKPNRASAEFIRRELLPELKRRHLPIALTIAGRHASLARSGSDGITYVADVPDMGSLYRQAQIVLAPVVFGGGTKNKTLEAMAWGRPVIGTPLAFTGIGTCAGGAFVSTPLRGAAMADALARLAADPALRAAMGEAGRKYVLECHTDGLVEDRISSVYERVLEVRV